MMIRIASLFLFCAAGVAAQLDCESAGNTDTSTAAGTCAYQNACSTGAGLIPDGPSISGSNYTMQCNTMPCASNQDIMFDVDSNDVAELMQAGCDNTIDACAELCEDTPTCCGFNFVFQSGSSTTGRCVAKACAGFDDTLLTSRYGMVVFKRDNGAATGSPTIATGSPTTEDEGDYGAATTLVSPGVSFVFLTLLFGLQH